MRRRQRQWLNDADTINYVDDTSLNDVKENKNLLIAAKKLKNLYRKMRESQRKKANAENAQAVKLLQKLEEEEMNAEAVDLLWELEQEDAVELLQDLEDEEQAVKLLQKLEDGDRKKRDIVAGKTRAKYKKLRLKNRAKTEKAMIQATDNAELEDFLRELEDEEAMIKATDNAELEDFLRQLDDVESSRDAVNLLKKLEGEAKKGKIASAKISSKYKKTRQKNRQRDELAMIAAANEAELEDQMIRATDLAEEAALHKDAVDHLTKLEADAKKSKNAAAKTLAKYAKVRQKNRQRDEQAMIQAADDAELQDQMIRATDEAEDKYLQDEAVKALGKLEKEAKKKKVLAGKTRDKYKQIRKKRLSRVNKENASLIKFLQKLEDEEENADAIELLQQLEDEDKVKQKIFADRTKNKYKKMRHKKEIGERRENAQAVKLERDEQNAELIDFLQTLEDAETTAEVANSLRDLKKADKKNIKMASKKIQDKYKKVRQKRKATVPIETLHKETEQKLTRDKKKQSAATIKAAKKILKKYGRR